MGSGSTQGQGSPETILVVEDSDVLRELIVRVLDLTRYIVLQATNGQDAVNVAADHTGRIDLLLSDVKMPGVSGPELAEMLQQSRPEIHVLLMSAFTGRDVLDGKHAHDWEFIQKPFTRQNNS